MVNLLEPGTSNADLTAPRPALVAYMADLMGKAAVGSAASIAELAFNELQRKLRQEAKMDAAVSLADLPATHRACVYKLATGTANRSTLKAMIDDDQSDFMDLLDTVCQPPSSSSEGRLQLLPPYPALFTSMLDKNGKLLVKWEGGSWHLHESLFNRLKFFGEHSEVVTKRRGPAISAAVLESLAANGIGVPTAKGAEQPCRAPSTFSELRQVPAVQAIFDILNTQEATKQQRDKALSKSVERFQSLESRQTSPEAAAFLANAGVHFLLWLRHVEAHAYISKNSLVDSGLRASIVDSAVDSAVRSWRDAGNRVTRDGLPFLPIRGPLGPVLNHNHQPGPATPPLPPPGQKVGKGGKRPSPRGGGVRMSP